MPASAPSPPAAVDDTAVISAAPEPAYACAGAGSAKRDVPAASAEAGLASSAVASSEKCSSPDAEPEPEYESVISDDAPPSCERGISLQPRMICTSDVWCTGASVVAPWVAVAPSSSSSSSSTSRRSGASPLPPPRRSAAVTARACACAGSSTCTGRGGTESHWKAASPARRGGERRKASAGGGVGGGRRRRGYRGSGR